MVAVKICGVCSPEDAALVASLEADYLGVILAPGRSRSRTEAEARSIYAAAEGVRRVGVFVDAASAAVRRSVARLALDVVQLHGGETPQDVADIRSTGCTVWKAVRVRSATDVEHALEAYAGVADALLLDGWTPAADGGAGVSFAWSEITPLRAQWPPSLRLVAAGGLRADNVAAAIAALTPDVVDVSSGVEAALCAKSPQKVQDFISAARAAAEGRSSQR